MGKLARVNESILYKVSGVNRPALIFEVVSLENSIINLAYMDGVAWTYVNAVEFDESESAPNGTWSWG